MPRLKTRSNMKELEAADGKGYAGASIGRYCSRISLRSIPARAKEIKTKTVFVMDLMNYDFLSNKVQLLLPLALGTSDYGVLLQQLEDAAGPTGLVKLKINVTVVENSTRIKQSKFDMAGSAQPEFPQNYQTTDASWVQITKGCIIVS